MNFTSRISLAATILATGLFCSDLAAAITSDSFTYSPAKTAILSIGPADLVPEATDAQTVQYSRSAIFFSTGHKEGDDDCFMAGLHLPQGAKLLRMLTTFESGAFSDPFFRLVQASIVKDGFAVAAFYQASGDNSGTRHTVNVGITGRLPAVDNSLYLYTYEICLGYKDVFYGARIQYQYTSAGN